VGECALGGCVIEAGKRDGTRSWMGFRRGDRRVGVVVTVFRVHGAPKLKRRNLARGNETRNGIARYLRNVR
jgi:hypothetical protein